MRQHENEKPSHLDSYLTEYYKLIYGKLGIVDKPLGRNWGISAVSEELLPDIINTALLTIPTSLITEISYLVYYKNVSSKREKKNKNN